MVGVREGMQEDDCDAHIAGCGYFVDGVDGIDVLLLFVGVVLVSCVFGWYDQYDGTQEVGPVGRHYGGSSPLFSVCGGTLCVEWVDQMVLESVQPIAGRVQVDALHVGHGLLCHEL
eukprot:scaffold21146_cov54-Attheya_sp.AAC.2